MKLTTVYLIRHAETDGNLHRIFQGRYDIELSENGLRQAQQLADRFRGERIDAVFTSPLERAVQTAKALNRYHNAPISEVDGLMEIDGGEFEGIPFDELALRYPAEYRTWNEDICNFQAIGGESMREVFDRIKATIIGIVCRSGGQTIAIVSHGCAIRNFLCYAKGLPFSKFDTLEWFANTAVTKIEFDGLKPHILFEGDTSHLAEPALLVLE